MSDEPQNSHTPDSTTSTVGAKNAKALAALSGALALVLSLMSMACAQQVRLVPHTVLGDMQSQLAKGTLGGEADTRIDAEITVHVRVPNQGLHLANTDDDGRTFASFELPPAPANLSEEALVTHYEAFYEQMRAERGTRMVQRIDDVGPALAAALQFHLERHFRSVNVSLEEGPGFEVALSGSTRWALSKTADLQLTTLAGPASLPPVGGHGRRSSGGHLGWAIPVMLVTGLVIGSLIATPILGSISRRHYRESITVALEEAAAAWAHEAATAWRRDGGFAAAATPVAVAPIVTAAPAPAPQPQPPSPCAPDGLCAEGFVCVNSMCVSACNPPCAGNEMCLSRGECVSLCNPPCGPGTVCTAQQECVAP